MQLPTQYQNFIHQARYAKWIDRLKRRELWHETVERYIQWIFRDLEISEGEISEIRNAILTCEVMPSMRAMMTAGEAADQNNIAVYNCAYTPLDKPVRLSEILLILMHGTGMGFSVESSAIADMPEVPGLRQITTPVIVTDSRHGWADAYETLVHSMFVDGVIPSLDVTRVRPKGAPLKTFGGRASGPGPFVDLWRFTIEKFLDAQGRPLTPLELHDIVCMIGNVVVCGGVRRSALISLSDLDDDEMRLAKSGNWWEKHPYRRMANNSAVWTDAVTESQFMSEWTSLAQSGSGERGIFNRDSCQRIAESAAREMAPVPWGTNPCSEIILRPHQFCNLTESVVRADDGPGALQRKAELAALLGTAQATKTDFRGLSPEWTEVTEEERLLGVSMTGMMDQPGLTEDAGLMDDLKNAVININLKYSATWGINCAASTTCVKPSGTVSQMVGSASGLHPRYAEHYIRRVEGDKGDPLVRFGIAKGLTHRQSPYDPNSVLFEFPMAAPEGAETTKSLDAVEHLEKWLRVQEAWCEHKPSITVNVPKGEWMRVGTWVWQHRHKMSGVAFLPYDDHTYEAAPYEAVTRAQFEELQKLQPEIDWAELGDFEEEDRTTGSQELACTGGSCDITHI